MTSQGKSSFLLLTASMGLTLLMSTPAHADTKSANHIMGHGPDVWRIELRDADVLMQLRSGDRRDASEISAVIWRLLSGDQYHQSRLDRPELSSPVGNDGPTYITVQNGQALTANIPEASPGTQLWVHARQQPGTRGGPQVLRFSVEISARDLDCATRRSCRRGDTGTARFNIEVDVPQLRSYQCVPQNSMRIWTSQTSPGALPAANFQRQSGGLWGGSASFTMTGQPILAPTSAPPTSFRICIASSTRSDEGGECDITDAICREARRRRP